MDLAKKSDIARQAINSISRHDDEDASVRHAMLQRLVDYITAERVAIDARVAHRIAQLEPGK